MKHNSIPTALPEVNMATISAWKRLLLLMCAICMTYTAFSQSANMDQGANGQLASPTAITWQNGNLNSNNSHYIEGQSVPYRIVMAGLPVGDTITMTLNFDITHGAKYAIDFITGYDWLQPHNFSGHNTPESINPLIGTSFAGAPTSLMRVTVPDYFTNNLATFGVPFALNSFRTINGFDGSNVAQGANTIQNSMSLWGGTFVQASAVDYNYDAANVLVLNNVNQSVSFTFRFVATSSSAVLAWGGHIARRQDWGTSPIQSAGGISGSPYHMRRESWSLGNIGNTDMQMQIAESAPICPSDLNPTVSICTNSSFTPIACPSVACKGATLFYSVPTNSGATSYSWSVSPSAGVTVAPNATSQSVSITYANAGSYTVSVTLNNNSGINTVCSVPVTISPGPTCQITGNTTICPGGATAFSATPGMQSYAWTGPGGFTASTPSTGSISAAGVYQVTITDQNGCTSTCSATLIVNPAPAAPTTTGASRCGTGIVSLSASGGANCDSLIWFSDAAMTTRVNVGPNFGPNIGATTNYWVICKSTAGCTSAPAMVTGTVNPVPSAPTTTNASRCGAGVVNLGASGGANCDSLIWFSDAALTTRVNVGATFGPNLNATTTYWVVCKSVNGCVGNPATVTGTVNPIPAAPTTTSASRCGTGVVNLSASGGANCDSLIWYTSADLTTRVNVGPTFNPNISATTTYWVVCKSVNGCVGNPATVTGTVNPIPAAPTTTSASRCGTGVVNLSASGGANCDSLIWFSSAALTTRVNVGPTFGPNLNATTTYWVVCKSVNGCVSTPATVVGTVNPIPAAPTTTSASRCGAGVVNLSASGGANCDSLIWFSDAAMTTRVNVGPTFGPNISATSTYWVVCKSVNGCVGNPATVTGTVNPIPSAPTTTSASRCGAGVVNLSANGGANCDSLIWFSNAALTTRVNVGPVFGPNVSATTTYWVICKSVNGCTSGATVVTATVNPVPATPTTTSASRCGTGIVNLSASGGANCDSLIWFSNADLTTRVNVGPTFNPNISATTNYWVICKSVNGCVSGSAIVTGTVNPIPAMPTTTSASRCGSGVVNLGASGGANCDSLIWFSDAAMTTRVNVGATFGPNISATTSYWVICKSVNGCVSGPAIVTGTVNPVPATPTTTSASRCGAGVVNLGASGGANCDSLIWFSDAALTTRVNVGATFGPNISATTSYWVICKSVNGCVSGSAIVTGTVNPIPDSPLVTGANRCGPGDIALSAVGGANCDSLIWFSEATLLNRLHTGLTFTPNVAATTHYWVVCRSASGCFSLPSRVTAEVLTCGETHCTYTQGYYGNKNGNSCDGDTTWQNPVSLINHLLTTNLVIGNGPKSVLIPAGAGVVLNSVMPGGQTPKALVVNGQCVISTVTGSCFKNNYLTSQGRINNVLLSQTITLSLNSRMQNGILLDVPVQQGYLVTQRTTGCGNGSVVVECLSDSNARKQYLMNPAVASYLTNNGTMPADVAGLLKLANDLLGGALAPGQAGLGGNPVPSYADVNSAVDLINNAFDGCRFFVGYNAPLCPTPQFKMEPGTGTMSKTGDQFTVYPNPNDGFFTIVPASGSKNFTATILDVNGKVIETRSATDGSKVQFNLSNMPKGIYMISIMNEYGQFRSKVLIQ